MADEISNAQLWSELDALGEDKVLLMHKVHERWGVPPFHKADSVELWLKSKSDARIAEAASRKESREEESLSIARKALTTSRSATRIATSAIVLSIAMAIQKIIEWYSK